MTGNHGKSGSSKGLSGVVADRAMAVLEAVRAIRCSLLVALALAVFSTVITIVFRPVITLVVLVVEA